jgi:hypothetical protein
LNPKSKIVKRNLISNLRLASHTLIGTLAALLIWPALTRAETVIDHLPYTITESGKYELQSSLTTNGPAILVQASNVVINLNGFTLAHSVAGNSDIGIHVTANNVTVLNGTVSRFGTGLTLSGSQCTFEGLRVLGNNGVTVTTGSYNAILDCSIVGAGKTTNTIGISLAAPVCVGILVKNNQVSECGYAIQSNSGGAAFSYNYVANSNYGLSMSDFDVYQGNIVTKCTFPFLSGHPIGTENGSRG